MEDKEKKYLEEKLSLIEAIVLGSLWGAYMFPPKDGDWGEKARYQKDKAMELIRKDVMNIYTYGKRNRK
jgi:hypothetical protein